MPLLIRHFSIILPCVLVDIVLYIQMEIVLRMYTFDFYFSETKRTHFIINNRSNAYRRIINNRAIL